MENREITGCKFDGGFSSLVYDENSEEHRPHPNSNHDRQQVFIHSATPWRHCRQAAVGLTLLAAALLTVDIGLAVHYNKLMYQTCTKLTPHNETGEKLQDVNETTVRTMSDAKKQLDNEMSRQIPTNWELEHQTRRSKDYEVQLLKMAKDIALQRYRYPMIIDGCSYCTPGWLLINAMCYYFSLPEKPGKSWDKAREYCQVHGGDLAVIDSKDKENATVNWLINTKGTKVDSSLFWIGLRDSYDDGSWKWVDGRSLVEGYWDDDEPNYDKKEECAAVNIRENFFKAWKNLPCRYRLGWICEKAPISLS